MGIHLSQLKTLIALLLLSGVAFAQNSRIDNIALGPRGPIPGATVAVCTQPAVTSTQPCSPLANLCSSLSDVTCIQPNPVTADSLGNYHFYIKQAQNPFTIQIYGPQVASPLVIPDQTVPLGNGVSANLASLNKIQFCDQFPGVDISVKCNAAITALPAGGGSIYVPAGTYTGLTQTINFGSVPVHMVCAGKANTILVWAQNVDGIAPSSSSVIEHCTLRGTNVNLNGVNNGCNVNGGCGINPASAVSKVTISDNIIEQFTGHGVNFGGASSNWYIYGNIIQNNWADGILVNGSATAAIISGNTVVNSGANGIDINASQCLVQNNYVVGNGTLGAAGIDRNGILLQALTGSNVNNCVVTGNTVTGNLNVGIDIRSANGQQANYNTISNNSVFSQTSFDGIQIDGTACSAACTNTGNNISGNTVLGNPRWGIALNGTANGSINQTVIANNTAINNTTAGIIVGNTNTADTTVYNNTALGNGTNVTYSGVTSIVVAGNKAVVGDNFFSIDVGLRFLSAGTHIASATGAGTASDITPYCTMAAGTCTASFTANYATAPKCVGMWDGTGTLTGIVKAVTSTSNVIFTSSVGTDTAHIQGICVQ
jgi:parallel beta-helix repeat protein